MLKLWRLWQLWQLWQSLNVWLSRLWQFFSMTMTQNVVRPGCSNSFQSSLEEAAELLDYRQRDKDAYWSDTRDICRLDAVMEQIETISRARADQRLKDTQNAVATSSSAPNKQMFARLVHLRQNFPDGTSFERAHEIANKIRKIGMVEKAKAICFRFRANGLDN
ncbi:TPA: hypothetical protein ACH3X1_003689 [Trebouxia sp. C0004]